MDLCINSLCRSLPNFDELPPGLPQELVDQIVASLTSHGALNSTTLKCLSKCELSVLNLANCRGVCDEWFISSTGKSIGMRSLSPARNRKEQRPRSASMPYGGQSVVSYPTRSINYATSLPSHEFSSSMMDIDDDYQEWESSPQVSMEDRSEAEQSSSSGSASFVSAFSSPCGSSTGNQEVTQEVMYSPLLPSVLPPPDFFSMKTKPMWQNPGSSAVCMPFYPSLVRQTSPLMPYASLLQNEESLDFEENDPDCSGQEQQHSSLTVLDLRGSRITDRGLLRFSHPSPLSSLEVVKLDNCHGITGRGLIAFAQSNNLHTLTLANCRRITDEAVINVSHLGRSLVAINLGGCRCLTDRSLEALSGLLELRKLDLSQVCFAKFEYILRGSSL